MVTVTAVLFNEHHECTDTLDFPSEAVYFRWLACTLKSWHYLLTYINRGEDGEELYI